MRPNLIFKLVLSYTGDQKDTLELEPIGSKGDKVLTVVKNGIDIRVRLTGDELRAWKNAL